MHLGWRVPLVSLHYPLRCTTGMHHWALTHQVVMIAILVQKPNVTGVQLTVWDLWVMIPSVRHVTEHSNS